MDERKSGRRSERKLAILAYHKIGGPSPGAWETWYYVPESTFASQLRQLSELGWQVIDVPTLLTGLREPSTLPPRPALITFDDGYRSVFDRALPVMSELGCPGVSFVPTDYIGDLSCFDANSHEPPEPVCSWDELRALQKGEISVQSHGVSHQPFSELSEQEIEHELVRSKGTLEQGVGAPVELFAFPYGDGGVDENATWAALWRSGYSAAFLFLGGPTRLPTRKPYAMTRIAMWPDTDLPAELA